MDWNRWRIQNLFKMGGGGSWDRVEPPPTPLVHSKDLVVAKGTKPPEASSFFLDDVVALIYVYVDDNAVENYNNRIRDCSKETWNIILPSVNVLRI